MAQIPDKRWSEQLKTDDIESHPETKEELKLYVVQRKFYHFLHGISDVLEPIKKLHSRSKHHQERVQIMKQSRGEDHDDDSVFNEEEPKEIGGKHNFPTSDSDADTSSSVHSESVLEDHHQQQQQRVHQRKSGSVQQNLDSVLGNPETGKLKSSIYKSSVMNYLERNLRNCKSSGGKSANVEDSLDDNNNTDQHRDYNSSSKENDGGVCDEDDYNEDDEYEEGDEVNEHRRKGNAASTENMNLGQELTAMDGEEENERAVANMKSMPKDEIKIMNFFNSIYNFNQQHSAHLKPPSGERTGAAFPRDQFEDSCKLTGGKWEDHTARFTILFRLQINRHRRIRKIVNYHRRHPRLLLLLRLRRRKDSYRRRLSHRRQH